MKQTFRSDILCAKEEELSSLYHMRHVVVRAKAAISKEYKRGSISRHRMPINDIPKRTVFVLISDRLNDAVSIDIGIQVIEGNYMGTMAPICRIALGCVVVYPLSRTI